MKIISTQENFRRAVFNTERLVSKQNTLPILNNILFEAKQNSLKLSATNLEVGVATKIGVKVEKEGKITIPAKIIGNFINNLPKGDKIELETDNQNLKIRSGNYKAVIKGLLADDFPLIPEKSSDFIFSLKGAVFKDVISRVISCVSFSEIRQELTGINIVFDEKQIFLAATDSFRLAEERVDIDNEDVNKELYDIFREKRGSVIVPASTLIELSKIIQAEENDLVRIAIEEGQIFFETGEVRLVSRLINGKYPEYKHIMPKDYKTRAVLPKDTFQSLVRMASVFTTNKGGEVTLKIDSESSKLYIVVKSVDTGENDSEVKIDVVGPSQEAVFNYKYLLDGINTIRTSQLAILLNNDSAPAAIKEIDDKSGEVLDGYTYIVMPIKN